MLPKEVVVGEPVFPLSRRGTVEARLDIAYAFPGALSLMAAEWRVFV